MRTIFVFSLLLAAGILLLPMTVDAATYYVATNGKDTNPGTQAAPWQTIQKAADTANAGDTVQVGPGRYYERVNIRKSGITFEGSGNRQSIIDGSDAVSGWVSDGNGVWKTTRIGYMPYAMTANDRTIWRISDLVMRGNIPPGTRPDGLTIMRTPPDATVNERCGPMPYWDGIEAYFGYLNGTTYARFRNGEDPATMGARSAPAGGTVTINGQSNIVVRNFRVGGGQHAVLLTGGAHGNTIEDSYLTNGYARVMINGGSANHIVRNNEITMNSLSQYRPGEWNCSSYARMVMLRIYAENKFVVGTSATDFWSSDENDTGVQVEGNAHDNQIIGNHIHDGVVGIKLNDSDNIKILGNTIHNFSAEGLYTFHFQGTAEIGGNLFYDSDHNIRLQYPERDKTLYIYGNRFHEPLSGGKHIHNCCGGPMTAWIYHNSFAGGGWAIDMGGALPNVHVVNNIFSADGISSGPSTFGEVSANINTTIWHTDTVPNFSPPSEAINAGIDLSNLPGMSVAYYGDSQPDIGAVQVAGNLTPPRRPPPPQGLRQVVR